MVCHPKTPQQLATTTMQSATTKMTALCSFDAVFSEAMRLRRITQTAGEALQRDCTSHLFTSATNKSVPAIINCLYLPSCSAIKHLTILAAPTVVLSATYLAAACAPATTPLTEMAPFRLNKSLARCEADRFVL